MRVRYLKLNDDSATLNVDGHRGDVGDLKSQDRGGMVDATPRCHRDPESSEGSGGTNLDNENAENT